MRISIIGLGWFGYPLALSLKERGIHVLGTTRSSDKKNKFQTSGIETSLLNFPSLPQKDLLEADVIVLNIPPFAEQLEWFKMWEWNNDKKIIFISSTSVYPEPETDGARFLYEQEKWIQENFSKWIVLRFGGLLGNGRHPGKILSGRKSLKGQNWPVNLIHLKDTIAFIKVVIDKNLGHEIVNVVSDDHRSRKDFYSGYCQLRGLPLPEFDITDQSTGKVVPNDALKKYYRPESDLWQD